MYAKTYSVAFQGMQAHPIVVECALCAGLPAFSIVGLPDKAVSEARDRIRAALSQIAISLPAKRVTINLSPANLPKTGTHFDLPITLSLLAALEMIPKAAAAKTLSLGEVSLDSTLIKVNGTLPAAMTATQLDAQLLCPFDNGAEAAWAGGTLVFGARNLHEILMHFKGDAPLPAANPKRAAPVKSPLDFSDVRGQEKAKRALEIAAAGRHNLLLIGPPGAGKSMLAARLPSILPKLSPAQALEAGMVHSLASDLDGGISDAPPFRTPHHSASMPALVGGGKQAGPGEISLAHNGVLFLDEMPEFSRQALETLRQPIETGKVSVARANAHVTYPCKFLLLAAANPCRCGDLYDNNKACGRAPLCGEDYMSKISGPLMDRFDIRLEVPPMTPEDMALPPSSEGSAEIAARVLKARAKQRDRFSNQNDLHTNADAGGDVLMQACNIQTETVTFLQKASKRLALTARGYHRILRVARTIADLEACDTVQTDHVAEAVSYRMITASGARSLPK